MADAGEQSRHDTERRGELEKDSTPELDAPWRVENFAHTKELLDTRSRSEQQAHSYAQARAQGRMDRTRHGSWALAGTEQRVDPAWHRR